MGHASLRRTREARSGWFRPFRERAGTTIASIFSSDVWLVMTSRTCGGGGGGRKRPRRPVSAIFSAQVKLDPARPFSPGSARRIPAGIFARRIPAAVRLYIFFYQGGKSSLIGLSIVPFPCCSLPCVTADLASPGVILEFLTKLLITLPVFSGLYKFIRNMVCCCVFFKKFCWL